MREITEQQASRKAADLILDALNVVTGLPGHYVGRYTVRTLEELWDELTAIGADAEASGVAAILEDDHRPATRLSRADVVRQLRTLV